MDYFNLALHWLCPTAPHLLRRVAAGMDRGGRFYQSEWPLRQGTRGRWRGLYALGVVTYFMMEALPLPVETKVGSIMVQLLPSK